MSDKLKALSRLAKDQDALQNLGKQIVASAAKSILEEKMNLKPSDPDVSRRIREGQVVPLDLLNEAGLKINPGGVAADGWEKTWTNLGLWDRNWSQNETDRVAFNVRSRIRDLRAEVVLSAEELEVAKDLDIRF